jgi:hypothetical protein
MKRLLFSALCLLFAVAATTIVRAEVYGPIKNYKGIQYVPGLFVVPTSGTWYVTNPVSGAAYKIGGWGGQTIYVNAVPTPIYDDSYLYTPPGFNPAQHDITLTEIITYDLEQEAPPEIIPQQRGFLPQSPEVELPQPPSPGQFYFTGRSGAQYPATVVETCPVGGLPGRLPGYDVSRITGDPAGLVYIIQGTVPASDFIGLIDFTCEYQGAAPSGDPEWPYEHNWSMQITEWDPAVDMVSDVDFQAPHIIPGYIEIIPPANWIAGPWYIGRYSFEANPGQEITAGGGTYGWTVKGKTPYVTGGYVYLTKNGTMVSNVVQTMVVAPEPDSCGSWNYPDGDFNHDCVVNFTDFATFAQKWLACSDPQAAGCVQDSIVGLGLVFDDTDTVGPARAIALYDVHVPELEPNDIIVKYRGVEVASGAALMSVIDSLPDLTAGEPVAMTISRPGMASPIDIAPAAIELPLKSETPSSTNKRCVAGWITPTGEKTCHCITGTYICACGWQTKHDANGKAAAIKSVCSDSAGNKCQGDWVSLK